MVEPSVLKVRFLSRPLFMKIELNKRQERRNRRRIKKGMRNKDNYAERRRYRPCDLGCGGEMSWCSCCEMYSNNCCIPYGTCQCS